MNRRNLITGAAALVTAAPAKAEDSEAARFRDALERIALLDEADGHELTWEHASRAVGIASQTLGKHPSQIFEERDARRRSGSIEPQAPRSSMAFDAMLSALLNVRKIISEAAFFGFNCRDGDWPERLFASQQVTSSAIAEARASIEPPTSTRMAPRPASRGDEAKKESP